MLNDESEFKHLEYHKTYSRANTNNEKTLITVSITTFKNKFLQILKNYARPSEHVSPRMNNERNWRVTEDEMRLLR
jgi:hypothetical protein